MCTPSSYSLHSNCFQHHQLTDCSEFIHSSMKPRLLHTRCCSNNQVPSHIIFTLALPPFSLPLAKNLILTGLIVSDFYDGKISNYCINTCSEIIQSCHWSDHSKTTLLLQLCHSILWIYATIIQEWSGEIIQYLFWGLALLLVWPSLTWIMTHNMLDTMHWWPVLTKSCYFTVYEENGLVGMLN